jgi:hypothetical protein
MRDYLLNSEQTERALIASLKAKRRAHREIAAMLGIEIMI